MVQLLGSTPQTVNPVYERGVLCYSLRTGVWRSLCRAGPWVCGERLHHKTGIAVLRDYDHVLSAAILDEVGTVGQGATVPGVQIHGITDRNRLGERVPTVSFTWGDGH